jgi:S-(hydroxymethyl)glutathione dehydrogenase/alcohol dehydrogenase
VPAGVDVLLQGAGFLAEKSLRGSFYGSGNPAKEIGDLARLVADRRFDVAGTVSHRTGLDGLADALERLRQGEGARTLLILDDELAGVDSLDV